MNNQRMYQEHLQRYLNHYTDCYVKWTTGSMDKSSYPDKFQLERIEKAKNSEPILYPGRKFDRIVFQNSTMAFVAKANGTHKGIDYKLGDVFKSATRKQPAKHVRGSIFDKSYDSWNTWTGPAYMHQMEKK